MKNSEDDFKLSDMIAPILFFYVVADFIFNRMTGQSLLGWALNKGNDWYYEKYGKLLKPTIFAPFFRSAKMICEIIETVEGAGEMPDSVSLTTMRKLEKIRLKYIAMDKSVVDKVTTSVTGTLCKALHIKSTRLSFSDIPPFLPPGIDLDSTSEIPGRRFSILGKEKSSGKSATTQKVKVAPCAAPAPPRN